MSSGSKSNLVNLLAQRYDAGSAAYDRYWRPMLEPMSAGLLDRLPLANAGAVLDLGCGPGTLAASIRQLSRDALLLGVDNSAGMLKRHPTIENAQWALMDARRLGLRSISFDIALLAFVLFHFPDIAAGLKEVHRILKPGGAIGLAVFHSSPTFTAKRVWQEVVRQTTPPEATAVTDLSAVDQTGKTDRPNKLADFLQQAGFSQIETELRSFRYQWQKADYLALRSNFGSSGAIVRSLQPEQRERLLTEVRQRFQELTKEDFLFEPTVLYATARVNT